MDASRVQRNRSEFACPSLCSTTHNKESMLHLATWLSLLSAVLAAPSPLQQLPFHSPAAVHPLGDRVRLPASESAHLVARLAELPKYDLARLEQHVHAWTGPRTVRLRAGNGQAGQVVKVTEGEKALLTLAGIRYVDITAESDGDDDQHPLLDANRYPSRLSHNLTTLSPLFETISLTTMKEFLVKFTGFHSRYYRSQSGRDSQLFLLDHLKTLHRNLNPRANVSFREFDHEWIQKSIIVRWEPRVKSKDYKDEVVILSAHQVHILVAGSHSWNRSHTLVLPCFRTRQTRCLSFPLRERTMTHRAP